MSDELETNHCVDCCCARSWKALGNPSYNGESIHEHIDRLVAENIALREALKVISAYDKDSAPGICPFGCDCPHIARAALEKKP